MRPSSPYRILASIILAVALFLFGCASDSTQQNETSDTAPTSSSAPSPIPTSEPPPTTPTSAPEPTTSTTETPAPTAGLVVYTEDHGLPTADVVSVDINPDGTVWAMTTTARSEDGKPGPVEFSRLDEGTWTTFPTPDPLEGPMRLAAGLQGTAWVVGGGEFFGNMGPRYTGTAGVWHFDGTNWQQIAGAPQDGDRLPISAETALDGVLWTTGATSTFPDPDFGVMEGGVGVMRYDEDRWTDIDMPIHLFTCIDCQSLYQEPDGTVWLDYVDYRDDEHVPLRAELTGDTWAEELSEVNWDAMPPPTRAGLEGGTARVVGPDSVYVQVGVLDVRATPGVRLPAPGETIPFLSITFDGSNWSPQHTGELTIGEGHTMTPGDAQKRTPGDVTLSVAHLDGLIYLTGLGGIHVIDQQGQVTTLTTTDGLPSNTTQHIASDPNGSLWIATAAGLLNYTPTTEGAPFGIDSVDLPNTEAEVATLFEAMPSQVEGQPRLEDTGLFARYGAELNVVSAGLAVDFDTGTVMESLSSFEDETGAEIEDSELDPDAAVVWVFGTFQDEGGAGKVHVAIWGEPDGEWLFAVNAQTPEMREALVRAFVDAS